MSNSIPKNFRPSISNAFYFIRNELLKKIKKYSPQLTGRMLDFGCGSKPYKSLFTNVSEYIGLDYESEGHAHTNESIDVMYDGKKIPFPDDYFDSVLSSEVFEHIFNLEEIIPEISRVMKKQAKILITCPFVWQEHEIPVDYARYTQFALKYLLERKGFRILAQDKTGDFTMAIYQMRMVYINEHFIPAIPLLGRSKFFRNNIPPIINPILNSWFSFWHWVLPKRDVLYLNNVILAEKL
ncbi:MAG TPA: class I SAM-dependent methyltransferase [Chitinophagaceae bacterium]|nr:class I SAM-dependent methyltransferase [Chitinophagaceae bacterium]